MKKWFHSKTIWLNIIASLLAILGLFDQKTLLALGLSSEKFLTIIGTITTMLNIILRLLMKKQIGNSNFIEEGPGGGSNPPTGTTGLPLVEEENKNK